MYHSEGKGKVAPGHQRIFHDLLLFPLLGSLLVITTAIFQDDQKETSELRRGGQARNSGRPLNTWENIREWEIQSQ